MAKLKIPTNNANGTFNHDKPNEQGYVNVVDNIILNEVNYYDFLLAEEDERPELLQTAAGLDENNRACFVFHETKDNVKEKISNTNCIVKGERDKKKKNAASNKPSKYTIPFPDTRPTSLDYLSKYAYTIFNLYRQGYAADNITIIDQSKLDRAHKFMFGMMLLTRCR